MPKEPVHLDELMAEFADDHPEIADALELFDMSFQEYNRAIHAQHPIVTYSARSTEGEFGVRLARDSS